ncbi:hypothetical protein BH20ACI4_BH20ACI4_15440 [soil metagenome]
MKYLVLIETSGNQRYIFSTNKLRENVGASELTYQIGTKIVLEAVGRKNYKYEDDKDGGKLRQLLLDEKPIENQTETDAVEIIIATSGKALLLTKNKKRAKEIVREVTKKALIDFPGLTVQGAVVEVNEDLTDIHDAVGKVHRRLEEIRYQIPSNLQRFQRLPFTAPCATSGLPASEIIKFTNTVGEDVFAFSKVTVSKRKSLAEKPQKYAVGDDFKKGRIINLLESCFDVKLPENQEKFEEESPKTKWLSVIHADGNGLGEIFLKFNEYLGIEQNQDENKKYTFKTREDARKYIEAYRKFSIALDICTINAAGFAIRGLQNLFMKDQAKEVVPIIPLILGGDDLTVLCDGKYAVKFTHDFLTQFEKETKKISEEFVIDDVIIPLEYVKDIITQIQGIIPKILNAVFGVSRLGICAGIAIIKPHYPFHQAYSLAEQLLKSAKGVKEEIQYEYKSETVCLPASALDYHVLYDSSGTSLEDIKEKLEVDEGKTLLFAKPYVVSNFDENPIAPKWLENRRFCLLNGRVKAIKEPAKDELNKRKIPNSQLHTLRERLHLGKDEAEAFAMTIEHRYKTFKKLEPLFFEENGKNFTHFLDAMEIAEFWEGFNTEEKDND